MSDVSPKAFISYSWTSQEHCELIRTYAERLVNDGIDVILDKWELVEGQDKYAFMEKIVTDSSVTKVLIFSDSQYAQKADAREAGVGAESQIISPSIYAKAEENKFIPLVCERNEDGEALLPTFLKGRIYIDFSSSEKVNENWEQLVRVLYGKPLLEKPQLGKAPSYITDAETRPALPTIGKFSSLKDALLQSKKTVPFYRKDFLDATIDYVDSLRVKEAQGNDIAQIRESILRGLRALLPIRDQITDWILLDSTLSGIGKLDEIIIEFLERILILIYPSPEQQSFDESWLDAHEVFAYELLIYIIAALIKADHPHLINSLLAGSYILPEPMIRQNRQFANFTIFYSYPQSLVDSSRQIPPPNLLANIIRERSTHRDISFNDVMQAELLIFLFATLTDNSEWYPNTFRFARHDIRFPLFLRAAQHKHFEKVKIATGVNSADDLRQRFQKGFERIRANEWSEFRIVHVRSFAEALNIENLDTIE